MAVVVSVYELIKQFLRRNTGLAGEIVTCLVTVSYFLPMVLREPSAPLIPTVRFLAESVDDDVIYAIVLAACAAQATSIVFRSKWGRWFSSAAMIYVWGALTWAAVIVLGWHPLIGAYAGYAIFSAYAVLSLLQREA